MPNVKPARHARLTTRSRTVTVLLTCWTLLIISGGALATPPLTLSGFGTLGVARSSNDAVGFVRDLNQPDGLSRKPDLKIDSMLGIEARQTIDSESFLALQVVSRYRYDSTWRPEVVAAYYRSTLPNGLAMRIGRLGTQFLMHADARLIGYASLMVRPPVEYYCSLVMDHFDGLEVSQTHDFDGRLLRTTVYGGAAHQHTALTQTQPWDLRDSLLLGGHVDWLAGNWHLRFAHARMRWAGDPPFDKVTGVGGYPYVPELAMKGQWSRFTSLGVIYDDGPLNLQLHASRVGQDSIAYESSRAAHALLGYRLGTLTPFLGYAWAASQHADVSVDGLPPALGNLVTSIARGSHINQHTWSLGMRWDVAPSMAFKVQVDRVRGASDSVFALRNEVPEWDGRLTVLSATLDFVF